MIASPATSTAVDRHVQISQSVLEELGAGYGPRDFAIRYWDGSTREPDAGMTAEFTLVLKHPGAIRRMFWPPHGVSFGEAYVYDDFDVEGDIMSFLRLARHFQDQRLSLVDRLRIAAQLLRLPSQSRPRAGHAPAKLRGRQRSIARDREAIGYAYDTSNEFYALWLDDSLMYTCAYFLTSDDTLEQAQHQKLDYLCRKLRLKPGERLLDIGCGWGGLVMHAVEHYGVEAVGITLSRRQVELATERIRRAGLEARCRIEYRDYREVSGTASFDKIVSVGMLEHLGASMMPTYFGRAWDLLRPGGVFLNHAITRAAHLPRQPWRYFARKYVFPDGSLETISLTLREAEAVGFEVRDVESLREHYALTLNHWLRRLESRRDEVVKLVGETTFRVFRLYLAGSQNGMRVRAYNLHQSLLAKPDEGRAGLPLTRADWYR